MKLTNPIIITHRLLPGVKINDSFVSIEYGHDRSDGRTQYKYHIDFPNNEYTSSDLCSGCQSGSLQEGLSSLLGFLCAACEAYGYKNRTEYRTESCSENIDLFPPDVVEWAYQNSDEISILSLELEERELIEE